MDIAPSAKGQRTRDKGREPEQGAGVDEVERRVEDMGTYAAAPVQPPNVAAKGASKVKGKGGKRKDAPRLGPGRYYRNCRTFQNK